jgi:hypothetical protein
MRMTNLATLCPDANCPAIYQTDRGTLMVRGYVVEPSAETEIEVVPGEAVVEIPTELVARVAAQLGETNR